MKIRYIFYLLVPLVIGGLASLTGFSLLWRLFILSLLLLVVAYLWSYFSLRNIKYQIRNVPVKGQTGDKLESLITLSNPGGLPKIGLHLKEFSDIPDYQNETVFNLIPHNSLAVTSEIIFKRRGHYSLGHYQLDASDPLGLFKSTKRIGVKQEISIYPATLLLPFFDPLHYMSQGYGPGRWLSSQISANVASIRDYTMGDSLKHIHWRTTAHSDKMMVKVFDPDRSQSSAKTIWLISDMDKDAQAGSGTDSTEEYNVTLCASIAKKYIELDWPVGFISQAEKPYHYPIESGSQQLEYLQASLASIQARGQIPIEQVILREIHRFNVNSLTIIVTSSWNEQMVKALMQLRRHQGMVVAILLDSGSFGGRRSMPNIPASLIQLGIQVYVIKSGDNLNMALDSRKI